MNKKNIGICILLCTLTAVVTTVIVSKNNFPSTNRNAMIESSSINQSTSGSAKPATTILLPTEDLNKTDPAPATTGANLDATATSEQYIGEEKAKEIAFVHAGINKADVINLWCELDYDDGIYEYEIEWEIGRTEYEYTISAIDGTILEFDIDID